MDTPPGPVQKPGELLVFLIRKETKCADCGHELLSGAMITLNRDRGALCLSCADLDHLEFLPSGDAALTRRATIASVRHRFTDYDLLLLRGIDRVEARERVYHEVAKKLEQWSRGS